MAIAYREYMPVSREIREILIADMILIVAFDLALTGGIFGLKSNFSVFVYFLPITTVAVTLSFVLHELMHKYVAQRFGAVAAFMRSQMGTLITIITAMFGFLIGIPGATMIFTNTFTKRENGIVSLAGPLTNFVVFLVFFAAGMAIYPGFMHGLELLLTTGKLSSNYLQNVIGYTLFISIFLAFFNMLPIFPLDGSKILAWNKYVYGALILLIFALFVTIIPIGSLIYYLLFWLVIAFVFSLIYRGIGL